MKISEVVFQDTLKYCSPAHGGWGIVRVGMLVPESYQLFVCPSACGRHGALGAVMHGHKKRLSYLYIDEADIVSGSYEEQIIEAVEYLLKHLPQKPKVLFIGVSCLDDLLGTDHQALLETLHQTYNLCFQMLRMNPITIGSKSPPPVTIQKNIYQLANPGPATTNCNSIGIFIPVDPDSEIHQVIEHCSGGELLHIGQMQTFEEFTMMGQSRMNLVFRPEGLPAAIEMEKNFGQPYLFLPVTYDISEIDAQYQKVSEFFGCPVAEMVAEYRKQAKEKIAYTREFLKNTVIYIDSSAVCRPFQLALFLLQSGFSVGKIFTDEVPAFEELSFSILKTDYPDLLIEQSQHYMGVASRSLTTSEDILAIGYHAGYQSKASYIANVVADEGLFGYKGLETLLDKMVHAVNHPQDVKEMIKNYGLVV